MQNAKLRLKFNKREKHIPPNKVGCVGFYKAKALPSISGRVNFNVVVS